MASETVLELEVDAELARRLLSIGAHRGEPTRIQRDLAREESRLPLPFQLRADVGALWAVEESMVVAKIAEGFSAEAQVSDRPPGGRGRIAVGSEDRSARPRE